MNLLMSEQEYWKNYTLDIVNDSVKAIKHYTDKVNDIDTADK